MMRLVRSVDLPDVYPRCNALRGSMHVQQTSLQSHCNMPSDLVQLALSRVSCLLVPDV